MAKFTGCDSVFIFHHLLALPYPNQLPLFCLEHSLPLVTVEHTLTVPLVSARALTSQVPSPPLGLAWECCPTGHSLDEPSPSLLAAPQTGCFMTRSSLCCWGGFPQDLNHSWSPDCPAEYGPSPYSAAKYDLTIPSSATLSYLSPLFSLCYSHQELTVPPVPGSCPPSLTTIFFS